ncbi:MAG: hypothetical protein AAGB15_15995 [Pseudomonadota bacterium]
MRRDGIIVLCAGAALGFVLGSVHAFSVFLTPLEARFGAPRADVSLSYSLALVSITLAVSLGHRLYALVPAWMLAVVIGVLGIAGVMLARSADSLGLVWLGYGVIFGTANGLGYGFGLQMSAQANPGREGLAMGLITAAYALGATVFPVWFERALDAGGFSEAMVLLAMSIAAASAMAAILLAAARARFVAAARTEGGAGAGDTIVLWLAYGAAVAAGLMATGHATGIAAEGGLPPEMLVAAPVAIAVCNMAGSLGGGTLADRVAPGPLLTGLPLVSALALGLLALDWMPDVLIGLGLIGLVYGAVISVYPAVIARRFGVAVGVHVYGRVFSAWAVAGLGGPWIAGWIFDTTGGYGTALWIAAGLACASAAIAFVRLRGQRAPGP